FDLAPKNLAKGDILEQAARNFRAAGREADFTAWVVEQRDRATSPRVRAQLSWILHDHPGTIRAIAEAVKAKDPHLRSGVYSWRREFHNLGVKQECAFLKAYVEAAPDDLEAHWDLLVLDNRTDGAEAARLLARMFGEDQETPRAWWETRF